MALDELEYPLGRRFVGEQHRGRTDCEREHEVGAGRVAEVELGHRQGHVVLAQLEHALAVAFGVVGEVVVEVHGRLGLAGGARGEQPDRGIVPMRLRALERFGRLDAAVDGPHVVQMALESAVGVGADALRQGVGRDQDTRARVLEIVRVIVAPKLGVDHGHDGSALEHAEKRGRELGRVGQSQEHPVLVLDVPVPQHEGRAIGHLLDVEVAEPPLAGDDCRALAPALGDARAQVILGQVELLGEGGRTKVHDPILPRFRWTRQVA